MKNAAPAITIAPMKRNSSSNRYSLITFSLVTTDLKGLNAEAIIACLEDDAATIGHADMLPEIADNMLAARDLLESILSRQPFEHAGERLQLVACTLSPEFKRKIFTSLAMADDEQRLWNDLLTASAEEAKK